MAQRHAQALGVDLLAAIPLFFQRRLAVCERRGKALQPSMTGMNVARQGRLRPARPAVSDQAATGSATP
ncbi:hypothetical protein [Streptomyces nigrescens]